MPNNKLILRALNSSFPTPFQDITLGSVLSHADVDNNFIYLKGELIYTGQTSGTTLTLNKINGNNVSVDLSGLVVTGGTETYTNATPMPVAVGGWSAGSTFSSLTQTQMWDGLLYPYQYPAITSFSRSGLSGEYEIGDSVTIGSQTFSWAISNSSNVDDGIAGSIRIDDLNAASTIADSLSNTGSYGATITNAISYNTIGSRSLYRVYAKNTQGGSINSTISRTWKVRWYYGKNASASITDAQMTGLTSDLVTSVVNGYVNIPATVGGEYGYLCIPNTLTQLTDIRDSVAGCFGTNIPYTTLADKTITNQFGVSVTYKVYRFVNPTAGSVNAWLCN